MIIEKNGHDIPDYLDGDFFRKSLEQPLKTTDFKITHIDFTMGSSGGENYLSFIYRVRVTYVLSAEKPKNISLIVKSIPFNEAKQIFAEMDIFGKEVEVYSKIIPRIEECLGGDIQIAPKYYYSQMTPIATIVFQDMQPLGHDVSDRIKGLNDAHCKVFLEKLAQYHAGGMILLEKEPSVKFSGHLKRGIFSSFSLPNFWNVYVDETLMRLAKYAAKWPGYEEIVNKLEKSRQNGIFNEKIIETMRVSEGDILTVIHGDSWVNNFLFRYENTRETPNDVVLIDFQGTMIGSIGLDVCHFLNSSLDVEVFRTKKDELVDDVYYPALRSALEKAKFKNVPSLEEVKNEIKKKAFYGFASAMVILPFTSMPKEDSVDSNFENMNDEDSASRLRDRACASPRFLDTMKISLKEYEKTLLRDL